MSIKEKIKTDLVTAMKAHDKDRVGTLRLIQAGLRKKEIDTRKELDDAGMAILLSGMVKQRQDSIDAFRKGNREDLVQKETKEMEIIQSYMPARLSSSDLEKAVLEAIQEADAKSMKDMGAVMKIVMVKTAGQADGAAISQLVRAKLS